MKKRILTLFLAFLIAFLPQFSFMGISAATDDLTLNVAIPYEDLNLDLQNDYTLEVGTLSNYFVYDYLSPISNTQINDNEEFSFEVLPNKSYFYRVTNHINDDVVTYGNYITVKENTNINVTLDDLYVSHIYDKSTLIDDFSINSYDTSDIFLNINQKGYLPLNLNDEFNIYPLRNWLPIEGTSNSKVILPDFNFEIIELEGNDVISIEENLTNSPSKHSLKLTAKNEGTAIVVITYDAMTNAQAMTGNGLDNKPFFSAISPQNSGVFVVDVDTNNGLNIDTFLNENSENKKLSGNYIDSELDVLYYFDENGATYSFNCDEFTSISVLSPTYLDGKVSYNNSFDDSNVEINEGVATISNLTYGTNIIKFENNGKCDYQLIRTKKLDYTTEFTRNGETINESELQKGDNVKITFDTVYHPANKLSGVYNNFAQISYNGSDDASIKGSTNQYQFANNNDAQTIEFTIPNTFLGDVYTLSNGCIVTGGFSLPFGSHRNISYENGMAKNFNALENISTLCSLPNISFNLSNDIDTKKSITVSVFDYTASEKNIENSSENGIVLDEYKVDISDVKSAKDAVIKAFDENNISQVGLESGYVSSINNLGSGDGYSGWQMAYNNDDYSNFGLDNIELSDGDNIRFDYTCNFDCTTDDIGNGFYGLPILTKLTVGDKTINMARESTFDSEYNLIAKYYQLGEKDDEKTELTGDGSLENPFIINIELDEKIDLSNATIDYDTTLNKNYAILEGINKSNDLTKSIDVTLSTLGKKYNSHYKITVTNKDDNNESSGSGNTKITVSFRLIGATQSSNNVDLSIGDMGYYGSKYVTWLKTKRHTIDKDFTVADLIDLALDDANIQYSGISNGYISSITAPKVLGNYDITELRNGERSGWMFTLNGNHTDFSMNDQTLKNNDKIILHYVNDYSYEVKDFYGEKPPTTKFYDAWLNAKDTNPTSSSSSSSSKPSTTVPSIEENKEEIENKENKVKISFDDVKKDDWYYDSVMALAEKNIIKGVSQKEFEPNSFVTRATIVTILHRLVGNAKPTVINDYTDIKKDDWYYDSINWAKENNIIFGYDDKTFAPNDNLSREQLVVILHRYLQISKTYDADLSKYIDTDEISYYAKNAMNWAIEEGIIKGVSNNKISPLTPCTRAELAQIIMRLENLK